MTVLQRLRNRQKRAACRGLALVLAVWLNFVFQACAMGSASAEECPHCPPGMHDESMPMAPMAPMDCGLIDAADDPDALGAFIKHSSDLGGLAFVAAPLPASLRARAAMETARALHEPVPSVHGPPSNVLYCVYLN